MATQRQEALKKAEAKVEETTRELRTKQREDHIAKKYSHPRRLDPQHAAMRAGYPPPPLLTSLIIATDLLGAAPLAEGKSRWRGRRC